MKFVGGLRGEEGEEKRTENIQNDRSDWGKTLIENVRPAYNERNILRNKC